MFIVSSSFLQTDQQKATSSYCVPVNNGGDALFLSIYSSVLIMGDRAGVLVHSLIHLCLES